MGGKGGGGGGSGGSNDWPDYMKDWHNQWLTEIGGNITAAHNSSPYTSGVYVYAPTLQTDGMLAALNAFVSILVAFHEPEVDIQAITHSADILETQLDDIDVDTEYASKVTSVAAALDGAILDEPYIREVMDTHSQVLQDDLESKVFPRFEQGMSNANAVMSSAFIVGEALLQIDKDRQIDKLGADLRMAIVLDRNKGIISTAPVLIDAEMKVIGMRKEQVAMLMDFFVKGVEFKRLATFMTLEALRITIVANKEYADKSSEYIIGASEWHFKIYQYGANMLGAISGGTMSPSAGSQPSVISSGIGGAMTGAVMGGMVAGASQGAIAGPWGMGIGAALGAIAGIFR